MPGGLTGAQLALQLKHAKESPGDRYEWSYLERQRYCPAVAGRNHAAYETIRGGNIA